MTFHIYGDNRPEIEWFRDLSGELKGSGHTKIRGRGANPPHVEDLIRYDRPDIILTRDGEPVLVVEKTREVPTGHNVGQRMARLVRAAEERIPTVFFAPFQAMKHGDHANICQMNIRLLAAFDRMSAIHRTPVVAVNWPADEYGELVCDGDEDNEMRSLVHGFLTSDLDPGCRAFREATNHMQGEYRRRLQVRPSYAELPGSVRVRPLRELLNEYRGRFEDPRGLLEGFDEVVEYVIGMTPANCKRQDPYTGMQFIYDYTECRSGPTPSEKHRALVLRFPNLVRNLWHQRNPNDPGSKSCNWYLTATAFAFQDCLENIS